MRLIDFIAERAVIVRILDHTGLMEPRRISPRVDLTLFVESRQLSKGHGKSNF